MPRSIHGKTLSGKQHRMWRHVYRSMIEDGHSPEAAGGGATNAVKKNMKTEKTSTLSAFSATVPVPVSWEQIVKSAGKPESVHALSGKLFLSGSGWLLLEVPAALTQGLFAALDDPTAMYPEGKDGNPYRAHISVVRPDELEKAGGPNAIEERGRLFSYQLGPIKLVEPAGWPEMEKVWFVEVNSPELEQFRQRYGLPALPKNNKHPFHITFAVKKRKVEEPTGLRATAKAAAEQPKPSPGIGGSRLRTNASKKQRYSDLVAATPKRLGHSEAINSILTSMAPAAN